MSSTFYAYRSLYESYGIQFTLKWWQFDECDVVIANIKVLFTKAALWSVGCCRSLVHASVLLKPTHCKTFCGYNGSFHSFRRKLTPAAAVLHAGSGCSSPSTHPTAERRPQLMSALIALPSMSARTVYYWTGRQVTGPRLLGDCAKKIGIPDYPVCVKPDVTRDAASSILYQLTKKRLAC